MVSWVERKIYHPLGRRSPRLCRSVIHDPSGSQPAKSSLKGKAGQMQENSRHCTHLSINSIFPVSSSDSATTNVASRHGYCFFSAPAIPPAGLKASPRRSLPSPRARLRCWGSAIQTDLFSSHHRARAATSCQANTPGTRRGDCCTIFSICQPRKHDLWMNMVAWLYHRSAVRVGSSSSLRRSPDLLVRPRSSRLFPSSKTSLQRQRTPGG
jgi:hypothetical protein